MMKRKSKRLKQFRVLSGVLLIVTLLGLTGSSIGCAAFGKKVIHPLEDDFRLVDANETITVKKQGALVSDYWLSDVAGVEVEK